MSESARITAKRAVSMVSSLELYLRVAGLCVGLAVGIVTLLSVYHDLRKKQKENK